VRIELRILRVGQEVFLSMSSTAFNASAKYGRVRTQSSIDTFWGFSNVLAINLHDHN
jgi:hypothetical protein